VITIRYESFENLEDTKRLSIINAGFMVFAEHGYAKASVEAIIKEANISKGSLFYYFETKKNFFLYLYEYCGEQMENLIDCPGPDGSPSYMIYTDFFERLSAIQILKMKHSREYPHMYNFMKKSVFDTAPAIKDEMKKINERYSKERTMAFFQGLDYFKFKDEIEPMMIIQLVGWTAEGCANQVMTKNKMNPSLEKSIPDFEEIIKLYQTYIQLFRNNFYKEEYL
jgi:AcrR family transcriptional regulator